MIDQAQDKASQQEDMKRLESLRLSILAKRQEAIMGRINSGIEQEWMEDEEHYQGIDDANRQYVAQATARLNKRWAETGRARTTDAESRSTVFLNITRPYVDAAAARIADMLLPTDDRAWALKPTPMPKLSPGVIQGLGGPEEAQIIIEQMVEQATEAAGGMQREIDDALVEANWHGECRSMIEDSARIGSGVLKGPYPVKRTVKLYRDGQLIINEEINPATRRIDPWNFYPDPACGESIHDGNYCWEREYITSRQIRGMLGMPGYDTREILEILKVGPSIHDSRNTAEGTQAVDGQYEMWIFYGEIDADDLRTAGVDAEGDDPQSAMAVLINDRMIKITLNVMDTGDFPYDVLAWQRRPGIPWGSGVSRHARTAQRILNAGVRALMDNAGASSKSNVVIGNGITPADGRYNLRGDKIWRADADVEDVRKAFYEFQMRNIQADLMPIIQFAQKMAEDTTNMPAMLQGQQGSAPDTVGGMQMLQNNASTVMRRLAKRFDDYVTEPHIQRYYDWMMQHSERDDIKGDFQIDVRASSALVERDAQQQFLLQMAQLARDPQFGIDPAKLFAELARGQRLDPKKFQLSEEEISAMRSKSNPVDEARAKLMQAQAEKVGVDTAKVGSESVKVLTEAQYAAMQAGQAIASMPQIAPIADEVMRNAGYQAPQPAGIDPNFPQPDVDVAPLEANTNTSPMLPPVPESAMQGIETLESDA